MLTRLFFASEGGRHQNRSAHSVVAGTVDSPVIDIQRPGLAD